MKPISRIIIIDYLCYTVGLFLLIVLLEPFLTSDFIQVTPSPYIYYIGEAISFFLIFCFIEVFMANCLQLTADYSQPKEYQVRRLIWLVVPCILLNTLFEGEYFTIIRWGWAKWHYFWIDYDGDFTLKWFLYTLKEAVCIGAIFIAYQIFVTFTRVQRYQIEELQSLNTLLETKHQETQAQVIPDKVLLQGESRDTIIVNPSDLLYVESVANYVNIVFFNGSDLAQKRLRCTLREIEEVLSPYSFIIHIHRAFLVNLNFITQVSGNTAGYKLQLFGTDKVLPVSKANVAVFRDKMLAGNEREE